MSEIGDLLELLHTSDRRWRTIRMIGRERRREGLLLEAFHRAFDQSRGTVETPLLGSVPESDVRVERWALSVARDRKVRAEFSVGDETLVAVMDGERWWHWSPSSGGQTNEADPGDGGTHGTGPGAALLETAVILPTLSFEITGLAEIAGRSVVAVTAVPEPSARDRFVPTGLHGIGSGADEYRFLVDAERGVLLRSEAHLGGAPFRVLEADEVAFDEELPPETFVLELPTGQGFSAPPEYRHMALDRLPGEVPFTVLVPEHPPVAADPSDPAEPPRAMIMPAAPRWNMPAHAHISYELGLGRMLSLRESAEPLPVREGQDFTAREDLLVGRDGVSDPPRPTVRMSRGGTHVELEAVGMSLEELIDLADTLVPLTAH